MICRFKNCKHLAKRYGIWCTTHFKRELKAAQRTEGDFSLNTGMVLFRQTYGGLLVQNIKYVPIPPLSKQSNAWSANLVTYKTFNLEEDT